MMKQKLLGLIKKAGKKKKIDCIDERQKRKWWWSKTKLWYDKSDIVYIPEKSVESIWLLA
jgi:hypothetical protein